MHIKDNKLNILFVGTDKLTNSMTELKDFFKFNLVFSETLPSDVSSNSYSAILIDESVLENTELCKDISKLNFKIKFLISSSKINSTLKFNEKFHLPINFNDLNQKILRIISTAQFVKNSSINIKDYTLDKNEKKLRKNKSFIIVTEKEIELLDLLFFRKTPAPKKDILKTVWKYSPSADTHTVETHIYRLRKKIYEKFNDDNFITNNKEGYKI